MLSPFELQIPQYEKQAPKRRDEKPFTKKQVQESLQSALLQKNSSWKRVLEPFQEKTAPKRADQDAFQKKQVLETLQRGHLEKAGPKFPVEKPF